MLCPNCGGNRPETGLCPYCDTYLPEALPAVLPTVKKLPGLDPDKIPVGSYKSFGGLLELRREDLLAQSYGAYAAIPYDRLQTVDYAGSGFLVNGKLSLGWRGNQDRMDVIALSFSSVQAGTFYRLSRFLGAVAEWNRCRELSFEDRKAQLDSQKKQYCPQCLSTHFISQKQGTNGILRRCPLCGHTWRL